MKTSIATVCISGDLKEKLAALASAGFEMPRVQHKLRSQGEGEA